MAGQVLAGIGADVLGSGLGALIGAGANAINQRVEFGYNQALQQNSFRHDKEMLQAQVQATKQLQAEMIGIKQGVLSAAGFSDSDAARGAVNAPMTKAIDWNGTRYYAPNSMGATSYSGQFTHQVTARQRVQVPERSAPPIQAPQPTPNAPRPQSSAAMSLSSGSWGQPAASRSTESTRLSSTSSSASRVEQWVDEQRSLARDPFMRGALQTAFVTPPSSRASSASSSAGTVSTVPKEVLDSWTPVFNTRRLPVFTHLRRRGESSV
uniref:VP2 minor structural protein n=1 Tax=California sea lion norovirus TaxID=2070151 RepID=A0A2R2ZGB0_9CALI|nr:VP2 minor structural protein [California sea lion norovirus]